VRRDPERRGLAAPRASAVLPEEMTFRDGSDWPFAFSTAYCELVFGYTG